MASAKAQEEKNAKAIRELMKLIPNKACFDCGQKGPVYANCTIGTFICTTCSGIHRELSHRCKSVSMSTFTSAEVEKLTNVGNENAAKEWHATWNPSEYPAPDGNDMTYLRKFLFLTYQDRKFAAGSGKGGSDTSSTAGSSKTKRTTSPGSSKTKREKSAPLPQPEPLSNILGPNIPPLDVGTSGGSRGGRGGASGARTEAPLINLLDDSPMAAAPTTAASKPASKDLLGDLMSLSMAPAPAATQYGHNPFGLGGAPASAPAVDPQQLIQLQTQVQNMQMAIMSAQQQMTQVQEQIQRGQAVFNQLNPQQREQLGGLVQRYQAMTTQFGAMTQQYNAANTKLQQMQAAAAAAAKPAPPPPTDLFGTAFGHSNGTSSHPPTGGLNMFATSGGFGSSAPSNPSLYSTTPSSTSHSSSNLFGASTPSYSTSTSSTSSTNLFGTAPPSAYPVATTVPPPNTSYAPPPSNDFFASLSSPSSSHSSNNLNHTSAPARHTDFHPFG